MGLTHHTFFLNLVLDTYFDGQDVNQYHWSVIYRALYEYEIVQRTSLYIFYGDYSQNILLEEKKADIFQNGRPGDALLTYLK